MIDRCRLAALRAAEDLEFERRTPTLPGAASASRGAPAAGRADGLDAAFLGRGLPWRAFRCGPRSGYCLGPVLPRTGADGDIAAYIAAAGEFLDQINQQ
jgi:hypothetical protein